MVQTVNSQKRFQVQTKTGAAPPPLDCAERLFLHYGNGGLRNTGFPHPAIW